MTIPVQIRSTDDLKRSRGSRLCPLMQRKKPLQTILKQFP